MGEAAFHISVKKKHLDGSVGWKLDVFATLKHFIVAGRVTVRILTRNFWSSRE